MSTALWALGGIVVIIAIAWAVWAIFGEMQDARLNAIQRISERDRVRKRDNPKPNNENGGGSVKAIPRVGRTGRTVVSILPMHRQFRDGRSVSQCRTTKETPKK